MSLLDKIKNPFSRSDNQRAITRESFYGETDDTRALDSLSQARIAPADMVAVPAIWMAVREIAEALASLAVSIVDRDGAKVDRPDLMAPFNPNPVSTAYQIRETQCFHLLIEGNSFSEIEFNTLNTAMGLWPIPPILVDNVIVQNRQKMFRVRGRLYTEDVIFHIPGISWNGITGESPASTFGRTVDQQVAIQKYASGFFRAGGAPLMQLLSETRTFPRAQVDQMLRNWLGPDGNYRTIVVPPTGSRLETLGFDPGDAQSVELEQWLLEEASRIFRIPRTKLNDSNAATYANREEDERAFVRDCIAGIAARFEDAYSRRFLPVDEVEANGWRYKFDLEPLVEPSAAEKAEYLIMLKNELNLKREWVAQEIGIPEDALEEEPEPEPIVENNPESDIMNSDESNSDTTTDDPVERLLSSVSGNQNGRG